MPYRVFPAADIAIAILFIVLNLSIPCQAIAVNSSIVSPGYVPDPSGRGTVGLVSSCVLTLSLCVWTAVHLNAFPPGTSRFKRTMYKVFGAVLGIVAPEIVLWRATVQWLAARKVRNEVNIRIENSEERAADPVTRQTSNENGSNQDDATDETPLNETKEKTQAKKKWTLMHGFFAVMGGITISTRDEYQEIFADGRTVTPRGIFALADLGLLPDIDHHSISTKGRSDQVAKTLVILQASWMLVQTIARAASGLPITLLELNTIAHVLCAVCMYAIWWHKPQNVAEQLNVFLEPSDAAVMAIASRSLLLKFQYTNTAIVDASQTQVSPVREDSESRHPVRRPENRTQYQIVGHSDRYVLEKEIGWTTKPDGMVMLLPGERLSGLGFFTPKDDPIHLNSKDIERFEILAELKGDRCIPLPEDKDKQWKSHFVTSHASNFYVPGNLETRFEALLILPILSLIYGGIHATSWNSHFPTVAEKIMWRSSVCFVGGAGSLAFVADAGFAGILCSKYVLEELTLFHMLTATILGFVGWALGMAFIFGRGFLVIEAFISIRSLPAGAYDTLSWVGFLPHIGG